MENLKIGRLITGVLIGVVLLIAAVMGGCPAYNRYQARQDAQNKTVLNEIQIQQVTQLVEVEKQRAQIRIEEAHGISSAQGIINATLTDRYLQHEAINAQEKMANSPNHTTIYIPSGNNGIPLVSTIDNNGNKPDGK